MASVGGVCVWARVGAEREARCAFGLEGPPATARYPIPMMPPMNGHFPFDWQSLSSNEGKRMRCTGIVEYGAMCGRGNV